MEHPLVTTSSTCNSKSPTWMSNRGEVTDISQLPITNIKYGPLKFQQEKVNITLGPIVCRPSENTLSIREQMVANQIEGVIRNETVDLKTKVTENLEKIHNLEKNESESEALKNLGSILKNETENLSTIITENTNKIDIIWEHIRCPLEKSGYFEVHGKCFFTDTILRNFDDSQAHCKEIFPLGGRLFEPRNLTTNMRVRESRLEVFGPDSHAFIGITDRRIQGNYQYESDNGQLIVSQWYSVEPNSDNEHCVTICHSSGGWCDDPCSSPHLHICERTDYENKIEDLSNLIKAENDNLKTKVTENSENIKNIWESDCPLEKSAYFEVLGKCYYSDNIKRNIFDSEKHCKTIFPFRGRLFEPKDQTTNKEVAKAQKKIHGSNDAWIGITDRRSHGTYQYASNNEPLSISKWLSGGPNNENDHCVEFCNQSGDWCDLYCSALRYHICERTY